MHPAGKKFFNQAPLINESLKQLVNDSLVVSIGEIYTSVTYVWHNIKLIY